MREGGERQTDIYQLLDAEEKIRSGIEENPTVSLVDTFLHDAIMQRASDIHLEPMMHDMRVRFRIDGVLYDKERISLTQRGLVLSRLKVLSGLDIAERRIPQDGKLRIQMKMIPSVSSNMCIDLRIATFPSVYGEKMVIRILDRFSHAIALADLGFTEGVVSKLITLLKQPQGFFLVTGPTGCGKTTTLYAMLAKLNNSERNIVTMEDPIEYHLEGVTQSQVNEKAGFTFANGLRSIVRQDPDVVMIGEIRDKPTVQIAVESALTGHLVLSTLHTVDATGAITRLLDMGVEPYLITGSLSAVLAQRLARRLCLNCKVSVPLSNSQRQALVEMGDINFDRVCTSRGCSSCFNLGYKGRVAVGELLCVSEALSDLIMKRALAEKIRMQASRDGLVELKDAAMQKVRDGLISLEEFFRVIGTIF